MTNRLEEKLGRECTDWDFDVQQELLERAQREIRDLKHIIWAIARDAPGHSVKFYEGLLTEPPERCDLVWEKSIMDMTMTIRAELRPLKEQSGENE
jgi:hypothetical protein